MSFKKIFITFALIGVFVLAMINFGVKLAEDNNSDTNIREDAFVNATFNNLNANLSTFQSTSQGQRENFESELPASDFIGTLIIFSIISAGRVFTSMIINIFNIITLPLSSVLGVDQVVIGVFTSILLISIIFGAWRAYKAGE